ncbi:glutathione peroxidase [Deefgea rivuli]|uniref:glutathione peroxidase n=1 Tax=Deefgea rivuli TaxID=400948 RepID=UPI0004870F58|nr:glutathione peroxidase [Deefgea rivuli]
MSHIYDFSVQTLAGETQSLAAYRGKVLLIVNVASQCGFTAQYADLQTLYSQYREQGLVILGFPCDQFGGQEPGSAAEIAQFCQLNFGVEFPMFAKVDVNGEQAEPLFTYLKQQRRGFLGSRRIKWNFTKFVINREGHVIQRFAPYRKITDLRQFIEKLLGTV